MKKKTGILLTILLAVFLSCMLISCSGSAVTGVNSQGETVAVDFSQIETVTVDETSVAEAFLFSEFDISLVKLNVQYFATYENGNEVEGEIISVPVSMNMVKAEDKKKLTIAGTHVIHIVAFSRFELEFSLALYSDTEMLYKVLFLDEEGHPLYARTDTKGYTQYVTHGGNPVIPTVESKTGYTFAGWLNTNSNRLNDGLMNITQDTTFKAVYEKNEFRVNFYSRVQEGNSYKDTLISSSNVPRGGNALSYAPAIPVIVGYSNGRWDDEDKMKDIKADSSFYAVYDKDQVNVSFIYKRYSASDETEIVKYDVGGVILNAPGAEYAGFKFVEWRVNGKKATFPYDVTSEVVFEAYYIPVANGNDGLGYTENSDPNGASVSTYAGEESVVVIPEKAYVGGVLKNVTALYDGVFKDHAVSNYVVSESNRYFITEDNVLYNRDKTALLAYPSAREDNSFMVPDSVTTIAPYAFYGAKNLSTVILGGNVATIGNYAFAGCSGLVSFTLTDTVRSIGDYAFYMPDGISDMTSFIFSADAALTSIGAHAFDGLSSLGSYALPSRLTSIGSGAFAGNKSLTYITAVNNASFRVSDGALYSDDFGVLYVYPALYSGLEYPQFVVNAACNTIATGAFSYSRLSSIVIGSDVTMEYEAIDCPTLKSFRLVDATYFHYSDRMFADNVPEEIVLPSDANDLMDLMRIVDAFEPVLRYETASETPVRPYFGDYYYEQFDYAATSGTAVKILGSRRSVSDLSLPGTINGYPVVAIGEKAFSGDIVLRNLTLPVALVEIGQEAFAFCSALETVTFGTEVVTVADRAFADCASLREVNYDDAFDSIDSFGTDVFKNTPYLDESQAEFIMLGNVLVKYNGYTTSVIVPESARYIAADAFKNKGQITSLTFAGNGLTTIDSYAFQFCTGLVSVTFPRSLEKVATNAFYGCSGLFVVTYSIASTDGGLSVEVDAYPTAWNEVTQVYTDTQKYTLTYRLDSSESFSETGVAFTKPLAVENTVNVRFDGWYYADDGGARTSVLAIFPMKLTQDTVLVANNIDASDSTDGLVYRYDEETDSYAVSGYTGNEDYVIVPAQYKNRYVRYVDEHAFIRSSIAYIELPNYRAADGSIVSSIEGIGADAFSSTAWYRNFTGDFITLDDYLIKYVGEAETVYIPNGVMRLAEGAFAGNTSVKTVVFPAGLSAISDEAFYGCTSLKKVVFPTTLVSIGSAAFSDCVSLTDVNFSACANLSEIGYDAFDNTAWLNGYVDGCVVINDILFRYVDNPSVHTLHLPNGLSAIGERAFFGNVYLRSVYVPQSVLRIGVSAFAESSIEAVNLFTGSKLVNVEERAFYKCANLSVIDLTAAKNLFSLQKEAFAECVSLREVSIPASVTEMGEGVFRQAGLTAVLFGSGSQLGIIPDRAFKECTSLFSVNFSGTSALVEIGEEAFYNCVSLRDFNNLNSAIVKMGDKAFYNCSSLINFSINSNALREIGELALENVGYVSGSNKNMVVLGNILIKFNGRESVVEIPANVTSIYNAAFKGNTLITEVFFPADSMITSINSEAFAGCTNLATINFPDSIVNVGEDVVKDTAWYDNQVRNGEIFILIAGTLIKYNGTELQQVVLPEKVSVINGGAFAGAKVYDILLGENVTLIKEGAFDGVDTSAYPDWTLTAEREVPPTLILDDPDSLTAKYILLPDSATLDGYRLDAVWGELYFKMVVPHKVVFGFSIDPDKGEEIEDRETHAIYEEIPVVTKQAESGDLTYIFIGWYSDYSFTQKVTYPMLIPFDSTLESVILYAKFTDDTQGSNGELYEVSGEEIKLYGFETDGYGSIVETDSKIVVPGYLGETYLKKIGSGYYLDENGHYVLTGESEYVYEESPTVEERFSHRGAFEGHTELVEVYFTRNSVVEIIGEDAFKNCVNLERIILPSTIKRICAGAFAGCTSLKEVVFPTDGSEIVIESGAFAGCSALRSVTLPASVVEIRDGAFAGCTGVMDVYLYSTVDIGNDLPFEKNEGMIIHIPVGTFDSYAATWEEYTAFLSADLTIE